MLSHCANPRCARPFLRLGQGKLFLVETESVTNSGSENDPIRHGPRHIERYWLCESCAKVSTLVPDRQQGVLLMPIHPSGGTNPPPTNRYTRSA